MSLRQRRPALSKEMQLAARGGGRARALAGPALVPEVVLRRAARSCRPTCRRSASSRSSRRRSCWSRCAVLFLVWARSQRKAFHLPGRRRRRDHARRRLGAAAARLAAVRQARHPGRGRDDRHPVGDLRRAAGRGRADRRGRARARRAPARAAEPGGRRRRLGRAAAPRRASRRPDRRPRDATAVTEVLRERPGVGGRRRASRPARAGAATRPTPTRRPRRRPATQRRRRATPIPTAIRRPRRRRARAHPATTRPSDARPATAMTRAATRRRTERCRRRRSTTAYRDERAIPRARARPAARDDEVARRSVGDGAWNRRRADAQLATPGRSSGSHESFCRLPVPDRRARTRAAPVVHAHDRRRARVLGELRPWADRNADAIGARLAEHTFACARRRGSSCTSTRPARAIAIDDLKKGWGARAGRALQGDLRRAPRRAASASQYFEGLLSVGALHSKINLPLKWFLGTYPVFLDLVHDAMRATAASRPRPNRGRSSHGARRAASTRGAARGRARARRIFNYDSQAIVEAFYYDTFAWMGVNLCTVGEAGPGRDISDLVRRRAQRDARDAADVRRLDLRGAGHVLDDERAPVGDRPGDQRDRRERLHASPRARRARPTCRARRSARRAASRAPRSSRRRVDGSTRTAHRGRRPPAVDRLGRTDGSFGALERSPTARTSAASCSPATRRATSRSHRSRTATSRPTASTSRCARTASRRRRRCCRPPSACARSRRRLADEARQLASTRAAPSGAPTPATAADPARADDPVGADVLRQLRTAVTATAAPTSPGRRSPDRGRRSRRRVLRGGVQPAGALKFRRRAARAATGIEPVGGLDLVTDEANGATVAWGATTVRPRSPIRPRPSARRRSSRPASRQRWRARPTAARSSPSIAGSESQAR